jgi:hypothetical protein
MKNSIREVHEQIHSLSPALAEVWFTIVADQVTSTTEVRGRMVGPRCPGRTTIEVAYPLQRLPNPPQGISPLTARVAIPDPTMWQPEAPFFYSAHIELWEDGKRLDEREFTLGLRTRA